MAICPKCGSNNTDGAQFCRICGEALPTVSAAPEQQYQAPAASAQPAYQAQPAAAPQPAYQQPAPPPQPVYQAQPAAQDKPGMTWGSFFWTRVLFAIPVVGFIFMCIWAFGGSANRTRVHYAVLFGILAILGYSGNIWREIERLF